MYYKFNKTFISAG